MIVCEGCYGVWFCVRLTALGAWIRVDNFLLQQTQQCLDMHMSTHKKYCEKMDYRQRMIYNLIDHVRSNRAKVRDPCLEQKLQAHIC